MYQLAEQKINEGLSLFPRLLLALCSTVFGLVMILVEPPTDKAPLFYSFSGLCFLVSLACVTRGRIRQFVGSLIGTALAALTLGYLGYEVLRGPVVSGSRSEPSVVTSILCFLAFGLPGARYVWKAWFGLSRSRSVDSGRDRR